MRLLIGYDGSSYADAAIADLQRAGLPPDVEALVVTVGDAPLVAAFGSHRIVEQGFLDGGICAAMTANTECSLEVVR